MKSLLAIYEVKKSLYAGLFLDFSPKKEPIKNVKKVDLKDVPE